jgi:hypothetical protein
LSYPFWLVHKGMRATRTAMSINELAHLQVTLTSEPRGFSRDWKSFLTQHGEWDQLHNLDEPLYCLPASAIYWLARVERGSSPVLNATSARAERQYAELCAQHNAVGSWQGRSIVYPYSRPPSNSVLQSLLSQSGWSNALKRQMQQGLKKIEPANLRLKGYVGWLLTEPAFLHAVSRLAESWRSLPVEQRPSFPLGRPLRLEVEPRDSSPAPTALATFGGAVRDFLDRWGLIQLTTWDLPDPQGPLVPSPLPANSPALPRHGIHIVLPLHYGLQGNDELQKQILEFQRQAARDLGLNETMAGLEHFNAYATMFDIIHLERTMLSRIGSRRPPRGFIGRVEQAVAAMLGGSLERVRKMRKAIARCRRGKRADVAWLRPRAR